MSAPPVFRVGRLGVGCDYRKPFEFLGVSFLFGVVR